MRGRLGQVRWRRLRRAWALIGIGMLAAAVVTELRKPQQQRTWQGHIGGVVPYSFRPPELREVQRTLWNPESDQVLVPRSFGVGWSVNFAALYRWLRRTAQQLTSSR